MNTIYILKLEDGCWYVGITKGIRKRILSHMGMRGAAWTQLHKMVDLMWIGQGDKNLEMPVTQDMIYLYGPAFVRGAGYTASTPTHKKDLYPSDFQPKIIKKRF